MVSNQTHNSIYFQHTYTPAESSLTQTEQNGLILGEQIRLPLVTVNKQFIPNTIFTMNKSWLRSMGYSCPAI
jgi:hypothetical protein